MDFISSCYHHPFPIIPASLFLDINDGSAAEIQAAAMPLLTATMMVVGVRLLVEITRQHGVQ